MGKCTFERKAPFVHKGGGGLIFEGGPIFLGDYGSYMS